MIWIRNGKIGGTTLNKALSGVFASNRFKGEGYISLTPEPGKITEVHGMGIGYAMGVQEFKKEYPEYWNQSEKFILARNPYSRWASSYNFLKLDVPFDDLPDYDFDSFNDFQVYHMTLPQTKFIQDCDVHILRLENIHDDYKWLCDKMGFDERPIEHLRNSGRKHPAYTQGHADFVYDKFKEDFNYLGYETRNN